MRLLVAGSRTFGESDLTARNHLLSILSGIWAESTTGYLTVDLFGFTIVEGGCPTGADSHARWWAKNSPAHSYDEFPTDLNDPIKWPDHPPFLHRRMDADWNKYGKRAGPIRNQHMINYLLQGDEHEERLVLGFIDKPLEESRGTFDCMIRAQMAQLPTLVTRCY